MEVRLVTFHLESEEQSMKLHARVLGLGAVLAAGIWFLAIAGSGSAQDDDAKTKEIKELVLKLADAVEKNDAAEIKKHTDALQKEKQNKKPGDKHHYELLP